jgi:hypothetical protein
MEDKPKPSTIPFFVRADKTSPVVGSLFLFDAPMPRLKENITPPFYYFHVSPC